MADSRTIWQVIPEAPNYEISNRGVIRNRKTGRILKWIMCKHSKTLRAGLRNEAGESICVTRGGLMNYLFGVRGKFQALPVHVTRGGCSWYFESCQKCSEWLATKVNYSASAVAHWLVERKAEICGYGITYLDEAVETKLYRLRRRQGENV